MSEEKRCMSEEKRCMSEDRQRQLHYSFVVCPHEGSRV